MNNFVPRRPTGSSPKVRFDQAVWDKLFGGKLEVRDSDTVKWDKTTKGLTAHAKPPRGGSAPTIPIKQFQVFEEQYNYLRCKEWAGDDNSTLNNPDIIVAKPYALRLYLQKPSLDGTVSGYIFTEWGHKLGVQLVAAHSNGFASLLPNMRLITFDGAGVPAMADSYTEVIDPPYFSVYEIPSPRPDGWNEDLRGKLLFAFQSANGVGPIWDYNSNSKESADIGDSVKWIELSGQRTWRKEIKVCDGGVSRYMRQDTSEVYAGSIVPP